MAIFGTIIKNGTLKVLLEGTDSIDTEVLKLLDGARCRMVKENHRMGDKLMTGCLIIELEQDAANKSEREAQNVVSDTEIGDGEEILSGDRSEIDGGKEPLPESG